MSFSASPHDDSALRTMQPSHGKMNKEKKNGQRKGWFMTDFVILNEKGQADEKMLMFNNAQFMTGQEIKEPIRLWSAAA